MRLEPHLHTHPKLSTRDQPSYKDLRDGLKRQEKKSKLSSPIPLSGYPISDADVGILSLSSLRRPSGTRATVLLAPALDHGLAERDITSSDVGVDNYQQLSHSLDEAWEPFIDDAVIVPPTGTGETPSLRDGSLDDFGRPLPSSLQHDSLKVLVEHGGGALGNQAPQHKVVTNFVEGQHDVMAPPSSVDMEPSCGLSASPQQDGQKKPLIIFYGEEPDEAELYTTLDYMVDPDVPRREDDIANMLTSDCANGLTCLDVSFECHGFRSKDDGSNWVRRRDAIIRAVRWLGAILGGSLSGLKVTAPWPELMFPCVPDILEVILDSFPGLESLHFADVQCECRDCKSLYTDDANFKRLQVSALAHQVSGPLRSTGPLRVTIERKSMHSLGKDYTKYTGDKGRLADEAILGTWTVSQNGGDSGATARPQEEAQFFVKLLKRDLPSTTHFSVVNPELRVTYDGALPRKLPSLPRVRTSKSPPATTDRRPPTPFPPPPSSALPSSASHTQMPFDHESNTPLYDAGVAVSVTDPSLELNGDVWPQDDISDKPGQETVEDAQFPQTAISVEGHQSPAPAIQPDGPGNTDLTFCSAVESTVRVDVMSTEGDINDRHGDSSLSGLRGIEGDSGTLISPFLSLVSSSMPVASTFGTQEIPAGPCISGVYDPSQGWAGSSAFNCVAPNIAPENPMDGGAYPACLQLDSSGSTVLFPEEFHLETVQDSIWTWFRPAWGSMLPDQAGPSAPREDSGPPPYGYPQYRYSNTSGSYDEIHQSDWANLGEDVSVEGLNGTYQEAGAHWGPGLEGDTVMLGNEPETVVD